MEQHLEKIFADMANPTFFQQGGEIIASEKEKLKDLEKQLESAYKRWEILENLNEGR